MKLILLENVYNLGGLGDTVTVKSGYGRNFLLPRGKAVPATPENIEKFEARREELMRQANEKLGAAQTRKDAIDGIEDVRFEVALSPENRLYGSIGPQEISAKLTEMGFAVEKAEVDMPEGTIREPGEFDIKLILHADVQADVKVTVVGEDG
ncbi:MAG: 50S ribosomal protein L9 [Pseudomonadota bacterium]